MVSLSTYKSDSVRRVCSSSKLFCIYYFKFVSFVNSVNVEVLVARVAYNSVVSVAICSLNWLFYCNIWLYVIYVCGVISCINTSCTRCKWCRSTRSKALFSCCCKLAWLYWAACSSFCNSFAHCPSLNNTCVDKERSLSEWDTNDARNYTECLNADCSSSICSRAHHCRYVALSGTASFSLFTILNARQLFALVVVDEAKVCEAGLLSLE